MGTDMAVLIIHALINQLGAGTDAVRGGERNKKLTDRGSIKESETGAAGGGASDHVAAGFSVYGDS